jgi:hypothetical protein
VGEEARAAMAAITLVTDLEPDEAVDTVRAVARDLGFEVFREDDWELRAQKGSLAASIFLGAFVLYCNFQIYIEEKRGDIAITIVRNSPWWTGLIGISRVKSMFKKLADLIEDDIEDQGGRVFSRKER